MSWSAFAQDAPELARLAYEKLNRKIAYLATIKRNGAPRLHPVTPFIGDGMLFIFTEPSSPKIRDLQRDGGRYALHSSVEFGGPLVEVLVTGETRVIRDPDLRRRAEAIAASPVVLASYYLFEFQVEGVLVVEYDHAGKPLVRRWRQAGRSRVA